MNIRLIEGQGADPDREARNLLARTGALAALAAFEPHEALDTVGYRSAGHTLVIGSPVDALLWADRLAAVLPVTVLLVDDENADAGAALALRLYPVMRAPRHSKRWAR
jgi:hypothetical protein